jgi:centrin-3
VVSCGNLGNHMKRDQIKTQRIQTFETSRPPPVDSKCPTFRPVSYSKIGKDNMATLTDTTLSETEIEDTKEAFDLFDTSRRGSIDLHAFNVAMKAMSFTLTAEEAETTVANIVEANGHQFDGRVDYQTFLEIVRRKTAKRDPVDHLMKAFNLFDSDNTGKISIKNIQTVATKLGEHLKLSEVEAMVDEFDRDQDGYINRQEFLYIMQQLH